MQAVDPCPPDVDAARDGADVNRVASAVLRESLALPGVVRVGLALTRGAGRELAFTASDRDNDLGVDWCSIDGMADVPLTQAVRGGAPIHLPDVATLYARYPELADRHVALGTRALAAYPLVDGDAVHGGLLLSFGTTQPFDDRQRAVLQGVALRSAAELTRVHEQSQVLARVDHGRGPAVLPSPSGVWLGQHHQLRVEADSGGTGWVDAVELPDGALLLAAGWQAGDRSAGDARRALRDAVTAGTVDPATLLAHIGAGSEPGGRGHARSAGPGAAAVALLDPSRRRLCAASTGGLVVVAGPGESRVVSWGSGRSADERSRAVELPLRPGAVVVVLGDPTADPATLATAVGRLGRDAWDPLHLAMLLGQDAGPGAESAAWSVLAARVTTATPAHRLVLDLPDDASGPRLARRAVRSQLDCWGVGDLVEAAEACVSELCTNALMHSATGAHLVLSADEHRAVLLVQNGGAGVVRRPEPGEDDVGGRGLLLVEALASRWDWQVGAEGTTVWCELDRKLGPQS